MRQDTDGLIEMAFTNRNNRTIASRIYHEGNSRVSSNIPLANEKTPYYFFISTGGGFLEGEKYELDVTVAKEAHAIVTTQAPTYVYKCDNKIQTTQKTQLVLEENSTFEYLTDEVIPYKNSIYKQETIVQMKENATLILMDGVTAGWSADEQPFQYAELQMKTSIYMDEELIYNDHLLSEPLKNDMSALGYFEDGLNYNTLIIISPSCTKEVIETIRKKLNEIETTVNFGISSLEKPGFVLRALGKSGEENRYILMQALNHFRIEQLHYPELILSKNDNYIQN
ncbi:hypothetical protein BCR24_08225 [Enterococcus ureilyticus]|uniref:Urease accessory protein UreD n=1 Tax=Enterococcus ureilyticus TaxID=1131292 RepID=A0A1E5H954_9ENTE|nr:urease accessory protein UreD [Enterococcus ureilyticus]MBM7687613.1 urease accessory protein [Enterococcus ureilyticus]MBO0445248.1 urease accessory protein UreD [Enterococcus ureilyticus]OEG21444.1 hypothetical protein BCR24_08225 [Enterococcus ureilyticus]